MVKEWNITVSFNEEDVKNQLPEELYSYLVERDLMDEFAKHVISYTEEDINENFGEIVGVNMRYAAKNMVWEQVKF